MRAVTFSTFGGPEVLDIIDLPDPQPGVGEVVIQVAAATINPTDVMMRSGKQAAAMTALTPPFVAGMEFSGHVAAVGEGVALERGQRVMAVVNPRRPQRGAQAGLVCVPAASVAVLAPEIDLIGAATVPMNGLTAKFALALLDLPAGGTVLVTGGTGAVGGYVLQLARMQGLATVATGNEADAALLTELGADHVAPRGKAMTMAVRALYPAGVDGLVDAALIGAPAASLVTDGGVAVSLRYSHPIEDTRLRTHVISVGNYMTEQTALTELVEAVRNGALTPRIAAVVPMIQAREGYARVEAGGFRGRVVLDFAQPN